MSILYSLLRVAFLRRSGTFIFRLQLFLSAGLGTGYVIAGGSLGPRLLPCPGPAFSGLFEVFLRGASLNVDSPCL